MVWDSGIIFHDVLNIPVLSCFSLNQVIAIYPPSQFDHPAPTLLKVLQLAMNSSVQMGMALVTNPNE